MKKSLVALLVCILSFSGALAFADAAERKVKKQKKIAHRYFCVDSTKKRVVVISKDGKVEWEYPVNGGQDAWFLSDGNVLFSERLGVKKIRMSDKKIVWEYKGDRKNEIHSCQPLPNGNVLIAECGACRLIEVDSAGKIVKEIKIATTTTNVHGQIRLARKTKNGTYCVAFTGEGAVREYDGDGKILRDIKLPGMQPYVALLQDNGNLLVSCGDGHSIVELDKNDKIIWRIDENDLPENPLRFVAGLQVLPNDNIVVSNWGGHGHVGEQPQIFEVTRDKKVVWQAFDNDILGTVSVTHILNVPGNPIKGEVLR